MRRCASCGRIYEDGSDLCIEDGSELKPINVLIGRPADELETRLERGGPFAAADTIPRSAPTEPALGAARPAGELFAGKYALIGELGSGGMGSVYEAENAWTGRRVAIKTLRTELLGSSDIVARFLQEGRATARIQHSNVLEILDMGQEANGELYIVQEFLVGTDLRTRLTAGPMTLREAIDALLPIMGALAAAHARGIIHRDVKPANIVLAREASSSEPVPKLIDFGVAKVIPGLPDGLISMTNTMRGELMGTPSYMSPEQIAGDPELDGRADIWSMGVVLYEALTGQRAFSGDSLPEVIRKILSVKPPAIRDVSPRVPQEIVDVIGKMMETEREHRFPTMRAVIDALRGTSLLSEDALGAQIVRRHRASLPPAAFLPKVNAEWHAVIPCSTWQEVQDRVASCLAIRGMVIAADRPPLKNSPADIVLELPNATKLELTGVVEGVENGKVIVQLDASCEIDLLLLEQVAATHVGPQFPAIAESVRPTGKISPVLGIDFGTSYTSAAVMIGDRAHLIHDVHGRAIHPSIVTYSDRGMPLVGWEARRAVLSAPSRTVCGVKRLLGRSYSDPLLAGYMASLPYRCVRAPNDTVMIELDDPPIPAIQIAALIIEHVKRIAEQQTGESFDQAALSVPVAFTEPQRAALRRAAERAGLKVVALIEEPVAGALACGFDPEREELVAIYDFGGGTFDFSLVGMYKDRFRVLSTTGDAWLGGDDYDLLLAQKVADEFWQKTRLDLRRRAVEWQRLLFASEQAKRALSFEERAEVIVEGAMQTPRVDIRQTISRAKLEELGKELTARSIELVTEALQQSGTHPRNVTQIAMTGGMSRAPFIRRELSKLFEREVADRVNPQEAVCIGAAIHGARLVSS